LTVPVRQRLEETQVEQHIEALALVGRPDGKAPKPVIAQPPRAEEQAEEAEGEEPAMYPADDHVDVGEPEAARDRYPRILDEPHGVRVEDWLEVADDGGHLVALHRNKAPVAVDPLVQDGPDKFRIPFQVFRVYCPCRYRGFARG